MISICQRADSFCNPFAPAERAAFSCRPSCRLHPLPIRSAYVCTSAALVRQLMPCSGVSGIRKAGRLCNPLVLGFLRLAFPSSLICTVRARLLLLPLRNDRPLQRLRCWNEPPAVCVHVLAAPLLPPCLPCFFQPRLLIQQPRFGISPRIEATVTGGWPKSSNSCRARRPRVENADCLATAHGIADKSLHRRHPL